MSVHSRLATVFRRTIPVLLIVIMALGTAWAQRNPVPRRGGPGKAAPKRDRPKVRPASRVPRRTRTRRQRPNIRTEWLYLPGSDVKEKVTYSIVDGQAILDGDILLGPASEVKSRFGDSTRRRSNPPKENSRYGTISGGLAYKGNELQWPHGAVPYAIGSSIENLCKKDLAKCVSKKWKQRIYKAVTELTAATNLHFYPRTGEADYIEFERHSKPNQGNSHVGMLGSFWAIGGQNVNLGDNFSNTGNVIHELLHAAGFWHTQSRGDRDNYVRVYPDRVVWGDGHNFDKHKAAKIIGPYDTDSIMHYGSWSFTEDGAKCSPTDTSGCTILKKNGAYIPGNRTLIPSDVASINEAYFVERAWGGSTVYNACLKSHHGQYVVAENNLKTVNANRSKCGPWERFEIEDINGGALNSSDTVFIRTHHGRYLGKTSGGALYGHFMAKDDSTRMAIKKQVKGHANRIIKSGDEVVFQTTGNRFLVAETNGTMKADRKKVGPWEKFTLTIKSIKRGHGTVACLRTWNNKNFVSASKQKLSYKNAVIIKHGLDAKADRCGKAQRLVVEDINGGAMTHGDEVWIQTDYDRYVTAQPGGEIIGKNVWRRVWEKFTIEKLNHHKGRGVKQIRSGDKVAFKSAHGKYLVAENGGGGVVRANRDTARQWETFTWWLPGKPPRKR